MEHAWGSPLSNMAAAADLTPDSHMVIRKPPIPRTFISLSKKWEAVQAGFRASKSRRRNNLPQDDLQAEAQAARIPTCKRLELQALETLEDLVFAREEIPRLKDLPTEKRRER